MRDMYSATFDVMLSMGDAVAVEHLEAVHISCRGESELQAKLLALSHEHSEYALCLKCATKSSWMCGVKHSMWVAQQCTTLHSSISADAIHCSFKGDL